MFISIHIPKTAGTALAYIFDYGSGRRILYDYSDDYSNATMDDLAWWTAHKPFIERQFDFIHGHFFYRKYAELFAADGVFLACLRHPVERIISQFNHVYFEANPHDWQYQAIRDDGLTVVDFA
ncbi:MAG: sulfotransferase family 2 domain-containing protein, partial [Mycobacteriales bacterium]